MRVTLEWNAGQLAGNQSEKAFRQVLAGMNDVGTRPPEKRNESGERRGVLRASASIEYAPIRKGEWQPLNTKRVSTVEGLGARRVSRRNMEIDPCEATVQLPHPPSTASHLWREDLGEE